MWNRFTPSLGHVDPRPSVHCRTVFDGSLDHSVRGCFHMLAVGLISPLSRHRSYMCDGFTPDKMTSEAIGFLVRVETYLRNWPRLCDHSAVKWW